MTKLNQERVNIILQCLGMMPDVLLHNLQQIKEKTFRYKKEVSNAHPNWNPEKDARIRAMAKLTNVIEVTQLEVYLLQNLADDGWWEENLTGNNQQEADYKRLLTTELGTSLKYKLGMSFFITIENYFRIFLRSIDSTACDGATGNFGNIYTCLLGANQLNFSTSERNTAVELLDFVRLIRNLIHNDGVYFAKDGQDKVVLYNGKTYNFYYGKPVKFAFWELLLKIADDILELLFKVISHEKIIKQPQIIDPFVG